MIDGLPRYWRGSGHHDVDTTLPAHHIEDGCEACKLAYLEAIGDMKMLKCGVKLGIEMKRCRQHVIEGVGLRRDRRLAWDGRQLCRCIIGGRGLRCGRGTAWQMRPLSLSLRAATGWSRLECWTVSGGGDRAFSSASTRARCNSLPRPCPRRLVDSGDGCAHCACVSIGFVYQQKIQVCVQS